MVKTITPRNIYAFLYAIFTLKNIWVVLCVNFEKRHTFILCRFPLSWETSFPTIYFRLPILFCANLRQFIFLKIWHEDILRMAKRKYDNTQTSTQPDASDRLLTRSEVAQYLNIGTTFIEQLRRQGKLPSYRLSGKCVRYKKSDCDVLLDHCFIIRPAKSAKKGEI